MPRREPAGARRRRRHDGERGSRGTPEPERILTTLLFTDIVGSTERASELGDRRWRELLEDHYVLVRRELARFRGREVKTIGDGFFASFDSAFVQSAWTMREVFSLVTSMFLAFGAAFEIPVVVFFLAIAGIVDVRGLLRGTPYAILVVFIVAAVLTPSPDWISQVMLGVPMVALYLLGILAAWLFGGSRARGTAPASGETALAPASEPPA